MDSKIDQGGPPLSVALQAADAAFSRQQAERWLAASEQRFRALAAHAPIGIFLADKDGAYLFVNQGWCAMTGRPPEDAHGQGWLRALHPRDSARIVDEWRTAVKERQPFASEYRFLTPQDKVRWVQCNAVGLRDERGAVSEHIGTCMDITERKAAETLLAANQHKEQFLASLAHELRNPLAPLRNGLETLRLASTEPQVVAKTRDMMNRQLSHLVRLVDDLFDAFRIGHNKFALHRSRVLLSEVIASAVQTARPPVEKSGHQLTITLPPEPLYLDADLTRLSQVFSALLLNSAKHTAPGGRIDLIAAQQGGQIIVTVQDNGVGIPAFALAHTFDIFRPADRSTSRTSGQGTGLALVKSLVELHAGTIEVASAGRGKGSTFTVRLPIHLRPQPPGPTIQ